MINKKESWAGMAGIIVIVLIVLLFIGFQIYNSAVIKSYNQGKIDGMKEICFKKDFSYTSQNQTFNISQDVYCNIQLNGGKK